MGNAKCTLFAKTHNKNARDDREEPVAGEIPKGLENFSLLPTSMNAIVGVAVTHLQIWDFRSRDGFQVIGSIRIWSLGF